MGKAQRRKQERSPARRPASESPRPPVQRRAPRVQTQVPLWLGPLLIVALGVTLYANSFSIPFLFDDFFQINDNPLVKVIEPLLDYLRRSRGLPALTFALNYRFGGLNPWGFHLVNVAVHLATALLVYALVLRTLRLPGWRERYGESAAMLAAGVALVFVAHPLQTMAASYIVQRAESLAAFFYLLTLLLFSLAWTSPDRWRRLALFGGAGLSALLGVVSKESVATVPAALLAYRVCFLPAAPGRSRATRLALAAALLLPLAYGVFLARLYLFPGAPAAATGPRSWLFIPSAGFEIDGITPWHYLLTQFGVIVWYLRLYVVPTRQCFDYGWPFADSLWRADVLAPLAVLLALLGAAVASYRRYPLATFCVLWLFITLAPTSSVIPLRDAAFEQRMYLPIVGLSWLLVVGGFDFLGWAARRTGRRAAALRRAGALALAAWIVLLAVATLTRNHLLQDPMALAADSMAKAPGNWRAHDAYAEALIGAGRSRDAIPELEEAIRLNPATGASRVELGQLYVQLRRYDDAERALQPAIAGSEQSVVAAAHLQLASVWQGRGDLQAASVELQQALRLKPQWALAHRQLAAAYTKLGRWSAAAAQYQLAVQRKPSLAADVGPSAARVNYLAALDALDHGDARDAVRLLRGALGYRPQWPEARHFLAYAHATLGEWVAATLELEKISSSGDPLVSANLQRAREHQPLQRPATTDAR